MLSRNQTEIYGLRMKQSLKQDIEGAVRVQLTRNVGVIAPNQIEPELLQVKAKNKNSSFSLHSEAISLYESNGGRIRLFNLATDTGKSAIPSFIPFTLAKAPSSADPKQMIPVVFVNMYRMGNWNSNVNQYVGLNAIPDLQVALETGIIAYKLIQEGKLEKVFNNHTVLETLTRIYTHLFSSIIIKVTGTPYGNDSFKTDLANWIIAKFFLGYCVQKVPGDSLDQLAFISVKCKSPLKTLQTYEQNMDIDYTLLSRFLASFGKEFFRDEISLSEFERYWMQLYGEGTALTIEYIPYLLHFLFAVLRGTPLGGVSKMAMHRSILDKYGLGKLYLSVISEIQ